MLNIRKRQCYFGGRGNIKPESEADWERKHGSVPSAGPRVEKANSILSSGRKATCLRVQSPASRNSRNSRNSRHVGSVHIREERHHFYCHRASVWTQGPSLKRQEERLHLYAGSLIPVEDSPLEKGRFHVCVCVCSGSSKNDVRSLRFNPNFKEGSKEADFFCRWGGGVESGLLGEGGWGGRPADRSGSAQVTCAFTCCCCLAHYSLKQVEG